MKSWKLLLVGWVLMGWIFPFWTSHLWAVRPDQIEKDIHQKKKDLKDIQKELTTTKEKGKKIERKESSVLESLHHFDAELHKREKELKQMELQLGQTKRRLDQTNNQVLSLNDGIKRTREEVSCRWIALYKMGRIPLEICLLTSQSYLDLLKIDKYLRMVIDHDTRLVNAYREQLALKEKYQEELIGDQLEWQRNISGIETKKEEIRRVRGRKRALLKSIQNQKVLTQKVIEELEERSKELQTLIGKLEREKKVLAYKRSKPDSPERKFLPPVHGSVISQFKERGQNGIEIKAPMEAEIRAILPGKVLYADWFKGFGNMVIIDHGDHTFTVSAYCSQLLKKVGDAVAQGETIARVGSAGSLKGPCLYFEIRHRGKPQDPMDWILHPERTVSLYEENKKVRK